MILVVQIRCGLLNFRILLMYNRVGAVRSAELRACLRAWNLCCTDPAHESHNGGWYLRVQDRDQSD